MRLVKTTKLGAASERGPREPVAAVAPAKAKAAAIERRPALVNDHDVLFERVAAATEELATGLTEASAAAQELRRSMERIASGAEEASGASRLQLTAIQRISDQMRAARGEAETLRRRAENAQLLLSETSGQISTSVRAIERNARRQEATVETIAELRRRAEDIGEITKTVSRISDQTNLLALNAAIEAARAGHQGRGFAVVADEVRALAETSDKSAQDVRGLAENINREVEGVVAAIRQAAEVSLADAKAAFAMAGTLASRRDDMLKISRVSEEMLASAVEAERAASGAQKGVEQVASASEQQSRGADEAQAAVKEQAKALEQGQTAARGLADAAEQLHLGKAAASTPEQIGATAEELSATIQELSSAAAQISAAVEQIDSGSRQQAAATQQTLAAMTQIETSAKLALATSRQSRERVAGMVLAMGESRTTVEKLVAGAANSLKDAVESLRTISRLETMGRRIERIIGGIGLTSMQTSMLSVSAAVEAARAGDAGRGFALVSKDISDLSREAAENVERASDTVRGILDQIVTLKSDLDRFAATAEVEVENNRAVFVSMDKVDAELALLAAAADALSQSAEVVLANVSDAAASARQIATAAEQAGAASRQAAAASGEQAQGAEDLAAAIEEIASLAEAMKTPHVET
jgi:methyl-accepting chemotaxis protein